MWKFRVNKHLKPPGFAKLNDDILNKYATVFNITKEELLDIDALKRDGE